MFVATMYSYGRDPQCAGVDGIVTCMGVFLSYGTMVYAIHLPDNTDEVNLQGALAFTNYVKQQNHGFNGKNARLYGVVNNNNRQSADSELRALRKQLGKPPTVRIRLRNNVDGSNAAAIIATLAPNNSSLVIAYQPHATANWQVGGGQVRAGSYKNASFDTVYNLDTTNTNWVLANASNSDLDELK